MLVLVRRAEMKSKREGHDFEERKSAMDRRQARRFEMCAPVIFTWTDGEGKPREGAGFSRNISTRGVFVIAHAAVPAVCANMELQVILPSLSFRSQDMELMAQGTVARIEKLAEGTGLGVASLFGMVEDSETSSSSPPGRG